MKNTLSLFVFLSLFLITVRAMAQCAIAEKYVADIQNFQDNATPTEYASSGKKIQAWTQFATWNTYKCQCDSPENLSDSEIPQLVNAMNATRGIISKEYSTYGTVPRIYKVSDCKKGSSNSSNSASSKTSTQIEMEKRFQNYNVAMSLKGQGIAIAKAFSEQVKQFGKMGYASNPQEQLNNFNHNMQQIAQMQSQNKADNLKQLDNTLGTALNQLNSGNGEGAFFSALSLIDQNYEQKEAKKEAERQKQKLIDQQQNKMSQFYWKAEEMNNQAINNYLKNAAYSFSKLDEDYNISYASHHRCFGTYMKNNYSYTNTRWTQNNCSRPIKKNTIENNLIPKDIQYINAAKRKYKTFKNSNNEDFREGAMRFAGAAATEKPKADYYYLMGHYAGITNPIIAFTSFEAARSLKSNYFKTAKSGEYQAANEAFKNSFKGAIKNNNLENIKKIIASKLHKLIKIEGQSAIIYAIKSDKPDIIQLFLNDYTKGKSQNYINTKVQDVIMMAAVLDAPNTIQRFIDLGFSFEFEINEVSPLDVAINNNSLISFIKMINTIDEPSYINSKSDVVYAYNTYNNLYNEEPMIAKENFTRISSHKVKSKLLLKLFQDVEVINVIEKLVNIFDLPISPETTILIKDHKIVKTAFFNILKFDLPTKLTGFITHDLISLDQNGRISDKFAREYCKWNFPNTTLKEKTIVWKTAHICDLFNIAIYYKQDLTMLKELDKKNYTYSTSGMVGLASTSTYTTSVWESIRRRNQNTISFMKDGRVNGSIIFELLTTLTQINKNKQVLNYFPKYLFEDLVYELMFYHPIMVNYINLVQNIDDYNSGKLLVEILIENELAPGTNIFKSWRQPPNIYESMTIFSEKDKKYWKNVYKGKYDMRHK
jgi:hypothetical protein